MPLGYDYYRTFYRVTKNNTVTKDFSKVGSAACFSSYVGKEELDGSTIELLVKKDYSTFKCGRYTEMVFTHKEVLRFLKELRSECGFCFEIREEPDQYVILLHEEDYINVSHVRIALDFVRLLWEKDINEILKTYFKLSPAFVREHGTFLVLQAIQAIQGHSNYGHKLPCASSGKIVTVDEMTKFLKDNPKHCSGSQSAWTGCKGYNSAELIKAVTEASKEASMPKEKKAVKKQVAVAV
jgi:hypothetical protein